MAEFFNRFKWVKSGEKITTTLEQRRKFYWKAGVVLILIFLVTVFFLSKGSQKPVVKEIAKEKPIEIRPFVEQIDVDRETWILQSSQRIKKLEGETKTIRDEVINLQQKIQSLEESQKSLERTVLKLPFKMDSIASASATSGKGQKNQATTTDLQTAVGKPVTVPVTVSPVVQNYNDSPRIRIYSTGYSSTTNPPEKTYEKNDNPGYPSGEVPPQAQTQDAIRTLQQKIPKKDSLNYYTIPSGSFALGVVLAGVYAPGLQGGGSASGGGPYPVLIEITDPYIMPSLRRGGLKNAFVIASAYGDLSSERAIIRLERISFIYEDGTVLDREVKGWIVGPDGMYGVHGKVVSRHGSMIARALLAGMLSGTAGALEQAGKVIQQTPLGGTISYVPPENVGKVAAYSGLSKAAEMLAQFYIQRASQLFPVIEVPAGTEITLVLMESIKVKLLDRTYQANKRRTWE